MREILFRGKCFHTEEWVEGYLGIEVPDELVIQQFSYDEYFESNCIDQYSVNPETVGQYTGLTDKNGRKIFEGDIIEYEGKRYSINYLTRYVRFAAVKPNTVKPNTVFCVFAYQLGEVIGNIHDNPELLNE